MSDRNQIVDVLRGLTMLYIVVIVHGLFWLKLLPTEISSLLLFEMPVIFMLSGYSFYLYENSQNQKKSFLTFIVTRTSRVLIPYYFYALFALLVVLLYRGFTSYEDIPNWSMVNVVAAWLNPFTFGEGHSIGMLCWHLWFIPIFLIVTALLPAATKIRIYQPALWLSVLVITICDYMLVKIDYLSTNIVLSTFFYLIWALFGYHLAYSKFKYSKQDYLKVIALCSLLLVMVLAKRSDMTTLNMGLNKFPPNYIFFLFGCLWVATFLIVGIFLKEKNINLGSLHNKIWLKPFIKNGYSVYLWQGFGYTLAAYLGKKFDFPVMLIWIVAIVVTIFAGVLAGPAEKIKIKIDSNLK